MSELSKVYYTEYQARHDEQRESWKYGKAEEQRRHATQSKTELDGKVQGNNEMIWSV